MDELEGIVEQELSASQVRQLEELRKIEQMILDGKTHEATHFELAEVRKKFHTDYMKRSAGAAPSITANQSPSFSEMHRAIAGDENLDATGVDIKPEIHLDDIEKKPAKKTVDPKKETELNENVAIEPLTFYQRITRRIKRGLRRAYKFAAEIEIMEYSWEDLRGAIILTTLAAIVASPFVESYSFLQEYQESAENSKKAQQEMIEAEAKWNEIVLDPRFKYFNEKKSEKFLESIVEEKKHLWAGYEDKIITLNKSRYSVLLITDDENPLTEEALTEFRKVEDYWTRDYPGIVSFVTMEKRRFILLASVCGHEVPGEVYPAALYFEYGMDQKGPDNLAEEERGASIATFHKSMYRFFTNLEDSFWHSYKEDK